MCMPPFARSDSAVEAAFCSVLSISRRQPKAVVCKQLALVANAADTRLVFELVVSALPKPSVPMYARRTALSQLEDGNVVHERRVGVDFGPYGTHHIPAVLQRAPEDEHQVGHDYHRCTAQAHIAMNEYYTALILDGIDQLGGTSHGHHELILSHLLVVVNTEPNINEVTRMVEFDPLGRIDHVRDSQTLQLLQIMRSVGRAIIEPRQHARGVGGEESHHLRRVHSLQIRPYAQAPQHPPLPAVLLHPFLNRFIPLGNQLRLEGFDRLVCFDTFPFRPRICHPRYDFDLLLLIIACVVGGGRQ
mmetsp:Transcript_36542/g.97645  ORF Transcript_36542/g.97645 Transcript_36542/m.97645 type:complete len:303 (-) Transcript_36542:142-1050(-)